MFVIQQCSTGRYVERPRWGKARSYTRDLGNAQRYATRAAAEHACYNGNRDRVVSVADLERRT